jgi:hypothetical protein
MAWRREKLENFRNNNGDGNKGKPLESVRSAGKRLVFGRQNLDCNGLASFSVDPEAAVFAN